ncbi:MAG: ribose-5-phosphate isomerase [Nocardioidaceae bacterium]
MHVHLGSDHAGFELKRHLVDWLAELHHDVVDHGAFVEDPDDDYPPFCLRVGAAVVGDPGSLGIVIGGSGNGEQIAANKVPGVRAALAWSQQTASLARLHNDANVVSIGARMHSTQDATSFVHVFLSTDFTEEARHVRRIGMLTAYEETGELPLPPDGGASPDAAPSA